MNILYQLKELDKKIIKNMKHLMKFNEFESNKDLNEGLRSTIIKGFVKSYIKVSGIIRGFKKLFKTTDRKKLMDDLKISGRFVDLLFFLNDSKWVFEDILTDEDIKRLAKKYDIDKDYPSPIDIFEAEYKKEFNRDIKKDLNDIYKSLTDEDDLNKMYDKTDAKTIAKVKQLTELIKDLKNMIES